MLYKFLKNNAADKGEWGKNEQSKRNVLIGVIASAVLLILVIVFFPSHVWAIVGGIALVVDLIIGLITLVNMKKG